MCLQNESMRMVPAGDAAAGFALPEQRMVDPDKLLEMVDCRGELIAKLEQRCSMLECRALEVGFPSNPEGTLLSHAEVNSSSLQSGKCGQQHAEVLQLRSDIAAVVDACGGHVSLRARLEAEVEAAVTIHHRHDMSLGVLCDELHSDFQDLKDVIAPAVTPQTPTPKKGTRLPESAAQRSARIAGAPPPGARPTRYSTLVAAPTTPKRDPRRASLRSASRERSAHSATPVAFGSSRPREHGPSQQRAQQKADMSLRSVSKDGLRRAACVGIADRAPLNVSRGPSRTASAMTARESPRKTPEVKPCMSSSPGGAAGQLACRTSSSGRIASKGANSPPEKFSSRRSFGAQSQGLSHVAHGPRLPASVSPTRRSPSQLGLPPPPAAAPPPVGPSMRDGTPRRRCLPSPPGNVARTTSVPNCATIPQPTAPSVPSTARALPSERRGGSARCPPGVPEGHGAPLALLRGPAGQWKAQLSEDLRAKVVTKCPQGHDLQTFATLSDTYPCNVCRKNLCCGSAMFGCRECNYDVCGDCFQRVTAILLSLSNGSRASPSTPSTGEN